MLVNIYLPLFYLVFCLQGRIEELLFVLNSEKSDVCSHGGMIEMMEEEKKMSINLILE